MDFYCDSLSHVTPDGKWYHTSHNASLDRLLMEMDKANVKYTAITAMPNYISNDFVLKISKQHADRLIPVAIFEPKSLSESDIYEHVELLIEKGFKAIKIHPSFSNLSNLIIVEPFYELASDKNLIFYLCTYKNTFEESILLKNDIVYLANKYKYLKMVLLHSWGLNTDDINEMLNNYPNLFFDVSFSICRDKLRIEKLLNNIKEKYYKKFLWGSDFPEYSQKEALQSFNNIANNITDIIKEKILKDNFISLFNL